MKEMVVSIKHNTIDTMNTQTSTSTTNLTPTNSPEPIIQSPNPTTQEDEPNNITEEIDIKKKHQIKEKHRHNPMKINKMIIKKLKMIYLNPQGKIKKEPLLESRD